MDFGRFTDDENLDQNLRAMVLDFPVIEGRTSSFERGHLHLGCPLWSSDFFKGTLYPKDTKKSEYLSAYAELFDCLELNTTHYNIPSPEYVTNWKNSVEANPYFKFFPKLPKMISHEGRLDHHFDLLSQFVEMVRGFGSTLGTCFLQLPPSFTPSRIHELAGFLELWPSDLKLAVEVRHLAWFKNRQVRETLKDLLAGKNVTWLTTDTPGIQDVLHQAFTTSELMIRFVTTGFHAKDRERMEKWSEQFLKYAENGVKDIYFFVHERDEWLVREIMETMVGLNSAHLEMKTLPPYKEETHQLSLF